MSRNVTGELLLSKVINENDVAALNRHGISRELFPVESERAVYDFIINYSRTNEGNAPSFATVIDNIPEFDYLANTEDSFTYLAKDLKKRKYQVDQASFINYQIAQLWDKADKANDPEGFTNDIIKAFEDMKHANRISGKAGHMLEHASEWYLTEFYERKQGKSINFWESHFPRLNEIIGGGYQEGNMITWYAKSGRGKSTITLMEGLEAAYQGANVLFWVLEMPKYEFASRALSFISAKHKLKTSVIDGVDYLAGFNVQQLTRASFDNVSDEQDFVDFVTNLNNYLEGSITIRAIDDEDFVDRSVRALERDIVETESNVVIVDPIYYMDYEKNTSKTTGGDAAATSKALRKLAGRTKVVMHVITQAEEDSSESTGSDRELTLPKRSQVKKTMAVLEDAALVLAFDSCDGRFSIGINKGRSGGEGEEVEGIFLPSIGYIEESNQEAVEQLFADDIEF